jgi:2'-5' RNA ligase
MAPDGGLRDEAGRPLRLFVAIEIPKDVRALVAAAVEPLRERHPRAKWVPLANQHVTLKFLGATPPALVEGVRASVADAAREAAPLATRVEGMGTFPSARRARVLWAGLEDDAGAMAGLASTLEAALEGQFPPERRAFTPHLTVARFDPPSPIGVLPEVRSAPFDVDRIVLFRSHLRRPAPVYEPLGVFPLGG